MKSTLISLWKLPNCVLSFSHQTLELARNPSMMQELMRSQDRAMSNLEVRVNSLDCSGHEKKIYCKMFDIL